MLNLHDPLVQVRGTPISRYPITSSLIDGQYSDIRDLFLGRNLIHPLPYSHSPEEALG